jgi:hypothetical protein
MTTDHETPWKELLEQDPERAIAFFYEDIHDDLDWTHDVESLEQEFRKTAPEVALGKRVADKLLKHYQRRTGDPRYLHFEIQSYYEADFPRRVYVYNSVAEHRYGQAGRQLAPAHRRRSDLETDKLRGQPVSDDPHPHLPHDENAGLPQEGG